MLGEAQGGKLVKFYGGEEVSLENLRADLESWGLKVERLQEEGILHFIADEGPGEPRRPTHKLLGRRLRGEGYAVGELRLV